MTESADSSVFGSVFMQSAYLQPLQDSACASAQQGWHAVEQAGPAVYLKSHSWGEFVFDFEIAHAYRQAGLAYYPKLVCAVPFTPVSGPRLLGRSAEQLQTLAREQRASSAHVLFAPEDEGQALCQRGWLQRLDLRYQWHNQDYTDFDQFLTALQSKKRKKLRAERRAVNALGLDISWQSAAEISSADWPRIYQLYEQTYTVRGQPAYLNQACLQAWGQNLPQAMQFCLARRDGDIVAMAFFFRDQQALYGRHWGSAWQADKLHFELCYYQGIDYCIRNGLQIFDAGVQGSHRILRGFEPSLTQSLHWFAEPRFHAAIKPAFAHESEQLLQHYAQAQQHSAYRRDK